MAISTVPTISGPNFGGVIYGLSIQQNYSNSPSTLKLNIVNKDGKYTIPSNWGQASSQLSTIQYGNFVFQGYPWKYSLKETAKEKLLEIEYLDGSVILDRYYVLLWKQAIMGDGGESFLMTRGISPNERILVPTLDRTFVRFVERSLPTINVVRSMLRAGKNGAGGAIKGNIIYMGTEMFKNSRCDIPSTYYTLGQLAALAKKIKGVNIDPLVNGQNNVNKSFQGTYEGTLREVLNSWCTDLGFDYYWNSENNQIEFYDVKNGIKTDFATIQNIKSDNLIEKNTSESMQGTYRQYAIAYTARPKEAVKVLPQTYTFTTAVNRAAIRPSWFLRRNGIREITYDVDGDGRAETLLSGEISSRRKDDFYASAFLGHMDQNLRNIYCIAVNDWTALGITRIGTVPGAQRSQLISLLKETNPDDIARMDKILKKVSPNGDIASDADINYGLIVASMNQAELENWQRLEQETLSNIGNYYRVPDKSNSFFRCTSTSIIEVDISVDPEGQNYEGNNTDFQGLSLYQRGGRMDRSSSDLQEAFGLKKTDRIELLENCLNFHLPPREDVNQIIGSGNPDHFLLFYPKNAMIAKLLKSGGSTFTVSIGRGTNKMEKTAADAAGSARNRDKNNCKRFDENVRLNSCIGAEEEAREVGLSSLIPPPNDLNYFSGLANGSAMNARITLFGTTQTIHAPSDSGFWVVINYNISAQSISNFQTSKYIYYRFDGNDTNPLANDVERIEVLYDNTTDSFLDNFGVQRKDQIPTAKSISNINTQKNINFVFAGNPDPSLKLSVKEGLSSLDISYSSDGFKTSVGFSSRPPQKPRNENILRKVQSQFNRASFNAT
jgi:hypothetical protein